MDNLLALLIVLVFTAMLLVLAVVWLEILLVLYAIYWLMRLSAAICDWRNKQKVENSNPSA